MASERDRMMAALSSGTPSFWRGIALSLTYAADLLESPPETGRAAAVRAQLQDAAHDLALLIERSAPDAR